MKRKQDIHNQPGRYARKCNIPIEWARRICKGYLKAERKALKNSRCPYCHHRALFYDSSGGDYYDDSWVECENCGEVIDDSIYPHIEPFDYRCDFDPVLYYSSNHLECECGTHEEWLKFVEECMKG